MTVGLISIQMDAPHEVGPEGSLRHLRTQWRKEKALLEQQNQLLKMNVLELRERTLSLQRSNSALVQSIDHARNANTTKTSVQIHRLQQENFRLKEQLVQTSMERDRSLSKAKKLKDDQSRLKERNSSLVKEKNLAQLKFEKQLSFLNKEFHRLRSSNDRLLESFQSVISNVNLTAINNTTLGHFNGTASSQKGFSKTISSASRMSKRSSRRGLLDKCTHGKDFGFENKENSPNCSDVLICSKCIEERSSIDGASQVDNDAQAPRELNNSRSGIIIPQGAFSRPAIPNLQINMLGALKENPSHLNTNLGSKIDFSEARREQVKTVPYLDERHHHHGLTSDLGLHSIPTDSSRGHRTCKAVQPKTSPLESQTLSMMYKPQIPPAQKLNSSRILKAELRENGLGSRRSNHGTSGVANLVSGQRVKTLCPQINGSEASERMVDPHPYQLAQLKHKRKSTLAHSSKLLMRLQTCQPGEPEESDKEDVADSGFRDPICMESQETISFSRTATLPNSRRDAGVGIQAPLAAMGPRLEIDMRDSGKRTSAIASTDLPNEGLDTGHLSISFPKAIRTSISSARELVGTRGHLTRTSSSGLQTGLIGNGITRSQACIQEEYQTIDAPSTKFGSMKHKTHQSMSQNSLFDPFGSQQAWNPIVERATESSITLEGRTREEQSNEPEQLEQLNADTPDLPNQSDAGLLRASRDTFGRLKRTEEVRESVEDCVNFNQMLRDKLAHIEDRIKRTQTVPGPGKLGQHPKPQGRTTYSTSHQESYLYAN